MKNTKVVFDSAKLDYSCELMRALAHPLRLKILEFIDQETETNVNTIYNSLNLEQSITSQHLRILKLAGVVNAIKDGKYVFYSIDYPTLERTGRAVKRFLAKA